MYGFRIKLNLLIHFSQIYIQHKSIQYTKPLTRPIPYHINDSRRSKIINMARSGNLQLGNRMRNKYGNQWKLCPVCSANGPDVRLNEAHVILECPAVKEERRKAGIVNYIQQYPGKANKYILRLYLGQDGCGRLKLLNRACDIHTIVERWMIRTQHL